MKLGKP